MDCIIFNFKNKELANLFVIELNKFNIATKNIPDALEWHFAKYWDHIFKNQGISKKKLLNSFPKSSFHLEKSVAIFIFASENLKKVTKKVQIIKKILNNFKKKKKFIT